MIDCKMKIICSIVLRTELHLTLLALFHSAVALATTNNTLFATHSDFGCFFFLISFMIFDEKSISFRTVISGRISHTQLERLKGYNGTLASTPIWFWYRKQKKWTFSIPFPVSHRINSEIRIKFEFLIINNLY